MLELTLLFVGVRDKRTKITPTIEMVHYLIICQFARVMHAGCKKYNKTI